MTSQDVRNVILGFGAELNESVKDKTPVSSWELLERARRLYMEFPWETSGDDEQFRFLVNLREQFDVSNDDLLDFAEQRMRLFYGTQLELFG